MTGAAGQATSATAVPVYVDSYSVSGYLLGTIAMPTIAVGNQLACTLTGSTYAHEGFGAASLDGNYFVFGTHRF
jgi:hypothetical protein